MTDLVEYKLFQVQIETKSDTYCFEIGTNDYDAVEIAQFALYKLLAISCDNFHVGGYSQIGKTYRRGWISIKKNPSLDLFLE